MEAVMQMDRQPARREQAAALTDQEQKAEDNGLSRELLLATLILATIMVMLLDKTLEMAVLAGFLGGS